MNDALCYRREEGEGERNTSKGMRRLGLEVVGRGVAVVLAAREVARLRPVARVVVLLAVEPAFQRVELLPSGRVPIDLRIQRLGDGLRGPPEALLVESTVNIIVNAFWGT